MSTWVLMLQGDGTWLGNSSQGCVHARDNQGAGSWLGAGPPIRSQPPFAALFAGEVIGKGLVVHWDVGSLQVAPRDWSPVPQFPLS